MCFICVLKMFVALIAVFFLFIYLFFLGDSDQNKKAKLTLHQKRMSDLKGTVAPIGTFCRPSPVETGGDVALR